MKKIIDKEKEFHNIFYKNKPDGEYMKNRELVRMFYLYFNLLVNQIKMYKNLKNCRILSLGSGTGRLEFELAPLVKEIIGIEISDIAVENANKQNRYKNVQFVCGTVTDLPFKETQFDVVISLATIHHVKDKEKMFREISRVLKDNGIFYAIEPNSWGILHKIGEGLFSKIYDKFHSPDEARIDPFLLKKEMGKFGFRDIKNSYCDFFLVPLAVLINIPSKLFSDILFGINRILTLMPGISIFSCQFSIFAIKKHN